MTYPDQSEPTLPEAADHLQNDARTREQAGTPVAQPCSADVHALAAMRRRHGDTPLGRRFSNLARKLKARTECQDGARRLQIEKNIRRDLAEIAELQARAS